VVRKLVATQRGDPAFDRAAWSFDVQSGGHKDAVSVLTPQEKCRKWYTPD
jgi:hypothetical protein